jgi:hypothetical protein
MVGCNERAQRFIHFPPKLGIPNKRLVVDFDVWRDGDQLACFAKNPSRRFWRLGRSKGPNLQARHLE